MLGAGGWLVHSGKYQATAQQPMPRAAVPTRAAASAREPAPKEDAVAVASAAPTPGETPVMEATPLPVRSARVVPAAAAPPMAEAEAAPDAVPPAAAEPTPAVPPKTEPRAANVERVANGGGVGAAFVVQHCIKCHGPDKQSGDVRLDDLPADATKAVERWAAVRDQVRDGLMPPLKEPRPEQGQARALVAWVTAALATRPARLPNEGNLIPHELLFGRPAVAAAGASPERIWRVAAQTYSAWLNGLFKERMGGIVQPFTLMGERGIRDYADLYTIDEPTRFRFAYGTLLEHVECGEEQFLLELADDGAVWYDIRSFSRPRSWAVRLGYPLARRMQRRFARESIAAMRRQVAEGAATP